MLSIRTAVDLCVTVDNIKHFSIANETPFFFLLHCCQRTKYFVMLSTVITCLGPQTQCPILSDFEQIWGLSPVSNFTKIRPVETALLLADRLDEDNRQFSLIMRTLLKYVVQFLQYL